MSTHIEDYIFSAKFDNTNFERNVQTSISTLGRLKEALNFKGKEKAFEDVAKAADNIQFDRMADNIEKLTQRFSTMGIVGMTVIQDITRAIEHKLASSIDAVFGKIKTGGIRRAMNVEQAKFLLQGLISDSAEVAEIMKNAKDSVDGTAYGYDQAAIAAAQFATSGVKAGEQMSRTLAGVAGVAATTNSEYSSISDIFSQVAGKGRLMGDELLQLSSRGLNAAAILAKYFNEVQNGSAQASESVKKSIAELTGGLQIGEGEIREWTSKGKITFDMFASAMSETFGAHAKDANKTLTGVLSNVNARFSQIGEKFVTPLVQQEGPLVKFFNTIKDKLADVRDNIDSLAELFTGGVIKGLSDVEGFIQNIDVVGFMQKFSNAVRVLRSGIDPSAFVSRETIEGLGLTEKQLSALGKTIRAVAREHGVAINDYIKDDGSFLATLKRGWLTFDMFKEAVNRVFGKEETKETVENINKIREAAIATIRGDYGNGDERIKRLTEAGFDPEVVQAYVDKIREAAGGTWNFTDAMLDAIDAEMGSAEALSKMSDEQLKSMGYTDDQIQGMKELAKIAEDTGHPLNELLENVKDPFYGIKLIVDSVKNVFKGFLGILDNAKKAFADVFPPVLATQITGFLIKLNDLSKMFILSSENADRFYRIFRGLFSAIKMAGSFIFSIAKAVFPFVLAALGNLIDTVLEVAATIGDWITDFSQAAEETQIFTKLLTPFGFILKLVSGVISNVIHGILDFIGTISKAITKFKPFTKLFTFLSGILDGVGKGFNKLKEFIESSDGAFSLVTGSVGGATKKLDGWITKNEALNKVVEKTKEVFKDAKKKVSGFIDTIGNNISLPDFGETGASLRSFGSGIKTKVVVPAFEKLSTSIAKIKANLPALLKHLEPIKQKLNNIGTTIKSKFTGFDIKKIIGDIKLPTLDSIIAKVGKLIDLLATKVVFPGIDGFLGFIEKASSHLPTLDQVSTFVKNLASNIGSNFVTPGIETFQKFIAYLTEHAPSLSDVITVISGFIESVTKDFNLPGLDKFIGFLDKLAGHEQLVNTTASMGDSLAKIDFSEAKAKALENFSKAVSDIKQQFIDPWLSKLTAFYSILQRDWGFPTLEDFQNIVKAFFNTLRNLDPDTVYMWVSRIVGILGAITIQKAIKNIALSFGTLSETFGKIPEILEQFGNTFNRIGTSLADGIDKVFGSISGVINSFKTSIKVGMILKIALAIGILAGAMWLLSKIPKEQYAEIAILMLDLALCLGVMFAAISIANKFGDPSGAAISIVGIALSLVLIADAIKKFSTLTSDELINAAFITVGIMAVLSQVAKFFTKINAGPADLIAPIALALAVGVLVAIIAAVSPLMEKHGMAMLNGLNAVVVLLIALGVCASIASKFKANAASVAMPIAFAVALFLLIADLVILGLFKEEWLKKAALRIVQAMAVLVLAMQGLKTIGSINMATALAPLTLVTALLILIGDIVLLGMIDGNLILKGGLIAGLTLLVISIITGLYNDLSGEISPGTALAPLSMVLAIGLLTGTIILIGMMYNKVDLWSSLQVVIAMGLFVIASSKIMTEILNEASFSPKAILTLVSFVLSLVILAGAIVAIGIAAKISNINSGCLAMITAAIGLLIVAGAFENVKLNAAMVIMPLEFTLVFVVLMAAIALVGITPIDVIFRGMLLMATVVGGLWAVGKALNGLDLKAESLIMPILFVGMIFALLEVVRELGTMNTDQFDQGIGGLVAMLLSMAVAFAVLSKFTVQIDKLAQSFTKFAIGAVILAGAFVIVSVGMVIFATAIDIMAQAPTDLVYAAAVALAGGLIALAVATKIMGGEGVLNLFALAIAFTIVAGAMNLFAYAMTLMQNVRTEVLIAGVVALAAGLILLTIAAKAGSVELLAAGLAFALVGVGLLAVGAAFILAAIGANMLAEAIQSIANVDPLTIAIFIGGLAVMILAMGLAATAGAAPLLALGAAFVLIGVGAILASVAFATFVGALPAFSEALSNFADGFSNLGSKIVEGLTTGIKTAAAAPVEAIKDVGGKLWTGFKNFFGINSPSLLMTLTSMFIPAGVEDGITAASPLATGAMGTMSTDMLGAFNTNMFGENGISASGAQIPSILATNINDNSEAATTAGNDLATGTSEEIINTLANADYASATGIIPGEVGTGITENSSDATSSMDDLTSQMMDQLGLNIDSAGVSDITSMIPSYAGDGVTDNADIFNTASLDMLGGGNEDMLSWIQNGELFGTGENFVGETADGLNSNSQVLSDAAGESADEAADSAAHTIGHWEDVGRELAAGLASGIRDGRSRVIDSAVDIAISAYNAAKNALDINSPSKIFARLGEGIDEGFVKGMEDKQGDVTSESRNLVRNMISTSRDALNNFADLLNGDIIDDPTITPVLDLSEIQNGANRLYSMMDEADRLSFSGNVDLANAASLSVSRDQQRKRESDNQMMGSLIDAINGLAGLIGNTGNVYNVNGVTYDDGSNVSTAVRSLIRAAKIEGRA